jgi:hypothetical protein
LFMMHVKIMHSRADYPEIIDPSTDDTTTCKTS